jgi:hypothetical protein
MLSIAECNVSRSVVKILTVEYVYLSRQMYRFS